MNLNNIILDKIPIYTVIATPTKEDVIELLDLFCNNGWKVDYYGRNPGIWYKHKTNTVFVVDKYHILTLDSLIFVRDGTKLFLWNEFKKKYMKEIKINIPEEYEIDKVNSTFDCIKLKPVEKLTYEKIMNKLFTGKTVYFPDTNGQVMGTDYYPSISADSNNCVSKKQVEKLLAINKLMNVAKYLNKGWKPDWNDYTEEKCYISIRNNAIDVDSIYADQGLDVYFRNFDLAQQAIEILGEDTIRLALTTNW